MHSPQFRKQDFINFITSVPLFLLCTALCAYLLYLHRGSLPSSIPVFDFILIILAVFRLSELFVYDKVMRYFRKLFETDETGLRRTVYDLLSCPWCVGVWAALAVTFFYFLTPAAWYFILLLAVSGVSTFIQITINLLGWSSEHTENEVREEESHAKKV